MNKASEVKRDELERIKQIIRTLQPAAEIVECDYAEVDLNKIINTGLFDFERTATSAGWIRGIEGVLTEEQKREADITITTKNMKGILITQSTMSIVTIIMKVVKWRNMASVLLFTIVVLRSIFISSTILLLPNGAVILSVLRGYVTLAITRTCLSFLNRPVCRRN